MSAPVPSHNYCSFCCLRPGLSGCPGSCRPLSATVPTLCGARCLKVKTPWPRPGEARRRSPRRQGLTATGSMILQGRPLPILLLLVHVLVISIWTNGVLASLYAGALIPAYRSTASLLSGIVNGIAAVLSNFLIDPVTAVITDQALQGQRDERDMVNLTYWLMFTRLLGTFLAQLLFIPTVHLVELLTRLMT